ncbi:hypothetical protein GCM10027290_59450 [Micromonospora sonneratiae]|uniref:Roadblock/LAMTOR2 domain-containing protein n=1 Tax=Micromonospora sonneratiae TaxID=1184706 RepID=A0ABW3Y8V0_9ACTN
MPNWAERSARYPHLRSVPFPAGSSTGQQQSTANGHKATNGFGHGEQSADGSQTAGREPDGDLPESGGAAREQDSGSVREPVNGTVREPVGVVREPVNGTVREPVNGSVREPVTVSPQPYEDAAPMPTRERLAVPVQRPVPVAERSSQPAVPSDMEAVDPTEAARHAFDDPGPGSPPGDSPTHWRDRSLSAPASGPPAGPGAATSYGPPPGPASSGYDRSSYDKSPGYDVPPGFQPAPGPDHPPWRGGVPDPGAVGQQPEWGPELPGGGERGQERAFPSRSEPAEREPWGGGYPDPDIPPISGDDPSPWAAGSPTSWSPDPAPPARRARNEWAASRYEPPQPAYPRPVEGGDYPPAGTGVQPPSGGTGAYPRVADRGQPSGPGATPPAEQPSYRRRYPEYPAQPVEAPPVNQLPPTNQVPPTGQVHPAGQAPPTGPADPLLDALPQRVPAEPDVPTMPELPAPEPSAETPELARIATHLRREDEQSPLERPEGFDVAAILDAVRDVSGVRGASLRTTPAGAHSLRLDLADGADPAEVSRQVARLLQERMGLAAAPQNLPGGPPASAEPPGPPPSYRSEPTSYRSAPTEPSGIRRASGPGFRPAEAAPHVPRRRRQTAGHQGRATVAEPSVGPDGPPSAHSPSVAQAGANPSAAGPVTAGTSSYSGGQVTTTETAPSRPLNPDGPPGPRVIIDHVQVSTFGLDATVEVRLAAGDRRANGLATGPAVDGYMLRLCATAAAAAIDELLQSSRKVTERGRCFVEHAALVPFGNCEVATVVVLLVCDGWVEQLAGSALVSGDPRQAVVRATLAAVNRRLEALLA